MIKKCKGCGVLLQDQHAQDIGYTPNLMQDYCQSCFRLQHYGDSSKMKLQIVQANDVLNQLSNQDGLFVWMVDLFHLEESRLDQLHRWLFNKPVVLLISKRELLPKTMSLNKIKRVIEPFIKESHLNIVEVLITGQFGKLNLEENVKRINELKKEFNKDTVYVFGKTNVGKSSFINTLTDKPEISVSSIPGTTLDFIKVEGPIDNLYDTAGLETGRSVLDKLPKDTVKKLSQKSTIKPKTYQLQTNQSLVIDGYGYIIFDNKTPISVTTYLPDSVLVHRTKAENAATQFERISNQQGILTDEKIICSQTKKTFKKCDLVIYDIGFISINGDNFSMKLHFKESVTTCIRKALL